MVFLCSAYHGHTVAVMDISPYKETEKPSWVHVVSFWQYNYSYQYIYQLV